MIVSKYTLKHVPISDDVVIDVSGIEIQNTQLSGVEIAKIEGQSIYAPSVYVSAPPQGEQSIPFASIVVDDRVTELSAPIRQATSTKYGSVKVDASDLQKPDYALKVNDRGYAYVTVPIADKFCTSAWYDDKTKHIYLSVGTDVLSINVSELVAGISAVQISANPFSDSEERVKIASLSVNTNVVEISAPDYLGDESTITKSKSNKFSVKPDVFAHSVKEAEFNYDTMTLGEYLSTLTDGLNNGISPS